MSKKIVAYFSVSGSGFGNTVAELQSSAPGAEISETTVLTGLLSYAKIKALAESCK